MSRRQSTPRPALAGLVLLVALLGVATPGTARAQCCAGPTQINPDPCGSLLWGPLGGYLLTGVALWPSNVGLSLTFGTLRDFRVGLEVPLNLPLGGSLTRPVPVTGLLARIRVLREGLDDTWSPGSPAPVAGLDLHARVGLMIVAGSDDPVALAFGPSVDLVLGGNWLVSFRPTISITPGEGSPTPVDIHPVAELAVGWLPGGTFR